jgi:hypothetical protein
MVRAFFPQAFSGNLTTNTNTPPQNSNSSSGGFIGDAGSEAIDEPSPVNTGVMLWNDIDEGDSGILEYDSTG